MQFSLKNYRTLQIGIHRKQSYFDFVWFDDLEQPQSYQIFVNDRYFKNRFLPKYSLLPNPQNNN